MPLSCAMLPSGLRFSNIFQLNHYIEVVEKVMGYLQTATVTVASYFFEVTWNFNYLYSKCNFSKAGAGLIVMTVTCCVLMQVAVDV